MNLLDRIFTDGLPIKYKCFFHIGRLDSRLRGNDGRGMVSSHSCEGRNPDFFSFPRSSLGMHTGVNDEKKPLQVCPNQTLIIFDRKKLFGDEWLGGCLYIMVA